MKSFVAAALLLGAPVDAPYAPPAYGQVNGPEDDEGTLPSTSGGPVQSRTVDEVEPPKPDTKVTVAPCGSATSGGVTVDNDCDSTGNVTINTSLSSQGDVIVNCGAGTEANISGHDPGDRISVSTNCQVAIAGDGGTVNVNGANSIVSISNTSPTAPTQVNLPGGSVSVAPGSSVIVNT